MHGSGIRFAIGGALTVWACCGLSADQSYTAKGSAITVRLVPEKTTIVLGEPVYLSFVVENRSRKDLQILVTSDMQTIENRARVRLSALRSDGLRVLPPPPAGNWAGNMMVGPQDLKAGKSYTFNLLLPTSLPIEAPGAYIITCLRLVQILTPGPRGEWDQRQKPDEVDTSATARLTVLAADAQEMRRVLDRLGRQALSIRDDDSAERAASALSTIRDPGVIDWLVRLLGLHDSRKSVALGALARFNSPAAFQAIRSALATRGKDIHNCTTAELAEQSAQEIRFEAALALSRSPYPEALPFLYSLQNNFQENVRLQVVHAAGSHRGAESTAVLQRMAHDSSKMVSGEALRYLKMR